MYIVGSATTDFLDYQARQLHASLPYTATFKLLAKTRNHVNFVFVFFRLLPSARTRFKWLSSLAIDEIFPELLLCSTAGMQWEFF